MHSWPWFVVSLPNTLAMFSLLGTFLSPKDFANGAKYNKKYESQDNSSNRADFDQAMQFHRDQVFWRCSYPKSQSQAFCPLGWIVFCFGTPTRQLRLEGKPLFEICCFLMGGGGCRDGLGHFFLCPNGHFLVLGGCKRLPGLCTFKVILAVSKIR